MVCQFIREGDLVKKCRAKNVHYRFFLFSDQVGRWVGWGVVELGVVCGWSG
jgi:hypothetical protein